MATALAFGVGLGWVLAAIAPLPKVNGTIISPMNVSTLDVRNLMVHSSPARPRAAGNHRIFSRGNKALAHGEPITGELNYLHARNHCGAMMWRPTERYLAGSQASKASREFAAKRKLNAFDMEPSLKLKTAGLL